MLSWLHTADDVYFHASRIPDPPGIQKSKLGGARVVRHYGISNGEVIPHPRNEPGHQNPPAHEYMSQVAAGKQEFPSGQIAGAKRKLLLSGLIGSASGVLAAAAR